jgi:hypothetical protein
VLDIVQAGDQTFNLVAKRLGDIQWDVKRAIRMAAGDWNVASGSRRSRIADATRGIDVRRIGVIAEWSIAM